jgi:hypothetical protein
MVAFSLYAPPGEKAEGFVELLRSVNFATIRAAGAALDAIAGLKASIAADAAPTIAPHTGVEHMK